MPHITFVVKDGIPGSKTMQSDHVPFAPFLDRGIRAEFLARTDRGETVWKCDTRYLEQIASWFAETPTLIPGFGYPVGTCLIYSFHA